MNNLFNLYISNEAIVVQTNSKLGNRLEKLFEECYQIRFANNVDYEDIRIRNKIAEKISKYLEPNIRKILLEETNFLCKILHLSKVDLSLMFAINFYNYKDIAVLMNMEQLIEGSTTTKIDNSVGIKRRFDDIINSAKLFDLKTGKLNGSKPWPVDIWFDIIGGFFLDIINHNRIDDYNSDKFTGLTPKELTAIILHETGHLGSFLEHATILKYVNKTVSDNISRFMNIDHTFEETSDFISKTLFPIIEYTQSKCNNNVFLNDLFSFSKSVLSKVYTLTEYFISKDNNTVIKTLTNITDTETSNVLSTYKYSDDQDLDIRNKTICKLIIKIVMKSIWKIICSPIDIIISMEPELISSLSNKKTSDIKFTDHNLYMFEKLADEFCIRHGYGSNLATSLNKMITFNSINLSEREIIRNSQIIIFLTKLATDIDNAWLPNFPYEDTNQRIRRIAQSTIAVFKNKSIPASFRDIQLVGLKNVLEILNKMDTDLYNRKSFQSFKLIMSSLVSIDDWIRILTSGRLTQEYERHLNQMEDLMNNGIYAHAADLKRISELIK